MKRREILKSIAAATATGSIVNAASNQTNTFPNQSKSFKYRKIDFYSHFSFTQLLDFLEKHNNNRPHVFRALFANTPPLINTEKRVELMDRHNIERSVLVPLPWLETVPAVHSNPKLSDGAARLCNNLMADLAKQNPDRFTGVALIANNNPKIMTKELERAVNKLNLAGAVLAVGPTAKRPDHPDYEPFYKLAEKLDVPIWLHPSRPKNYPDYADEQISRFQVWQAFSWLLDSTTAMVRIAFAGIFERYPNLKIIIHHHGAMVPMFANRLTHGCDFFEAASGLQIDTSIDKPYADHLKKFYVDTATQGYDPLVLQSAYNFFGPDKMLFGTDAPMDKTAGEIFTSTANQSLNEIDITQQDKQKIYHKNALKLLKLH